MDLSIIIINYNSKKLLSDCLSSFFDFRPVLKFEIIVVDNNSNDQSKEEITARFPDLTWIDMGYNAGFSRANNKGIKIARGKYILLLNADTLFISNILDNLINQFDHLFDYSALGVQLLNTDGSKQNSGAKFVMGGLNNILQLPYIGDLARYVAYSIGMKNPNVVSSASFESVGWISGAFLCVRAESIEKAGLMDEDFFLYSEEIEWCSRLEIYGKLGIVGDLSIIHIGSGSTQSLTNDKEHNYKNISDKKGRQVLVSNFLRMKKQFGVFWTLILFGFYLLELVVFPIGLIIENIIHLKNPFANFNLVIGFYKNMIVLVRNIPSIFFGINKLYKVI